MKRDIIAETLEKEFEIICEVGTGAIDLNSIKKEIQKIIGYEIISMRIKSNKIYGIFVDQDKPISAS